MAPGTRYRIKLVVMVVLGLVAVSLFMLFLPRFLGGTQPTLPEVVFTDPVSDEEKAMFGFEVADEASEWAQGLQNRDQLPHDQGLLFIFPTAGPRTFWMKDVRFPIDIIFIDEHRTVVTIYHTLPPCENDPCEVYPSIESVKYVLEVNAGLSEAYGIERGDLVEIP